MSHPHSEPEAHECIAHRLCSELETSSLDAALPARPSSQSGADDTMPAPSSPLWNFAKETMLAQKALRLEVQRIEARVSSLDAHIRCLVFLTSIKTPLREDEERDRKQTLAALRAAVADYYIAEEQ